MGVMASLITGVSFVNSTVCSGTDQRNFQSSASLAFVRGIHRWFPAQRASNVEKVSIWWRRHDANEYTGFDASLSFCTCFYLINRFQSKLHWECSHCFYTYIFIILFYIWAQNLLISLTNDFLTFTLHDSIIINEVLFNIWSQNQFMLIMSSSEAGWCWVLHVALLAIWMVLYSANLRQTTCKTLVIDQGKRRNFGQVVLLKWKIKQTEPKYALIVNLICVHADW